MLSRTTPAPHYPSLEPSILLKVQWKEWKDPLDGAGRVWIPFQQLEEDLLVYSHRTKLALSGGNQPSMSNMTPPVKRWHACQSWRRQRGSDSGARGQVTISPHAYIGTVQHMLFPALLIFIGVSSLGRPYKAHNIIIGSGDFPIEGCQNAVSFVLYPNSTKCSNAPFHLPPMQTIQIQTRMLGQGRHIGGMQEMVL